MSYFTLEQEVALKRMAEKEITMYLSVPRPDQIEERVESNRLAYSVYKENAKVQHPEMTEEEIYREWMLEKLSRLQLLVEILFR